MQSAILHRRVATCRSILLLLSGGRTQEVYGEDPTHAAEMVGRYVRGMQQRGRAPAGAAQPELLLAGSVTKHWMVRARRSGFSMCSKTAAAQHPDPLAWCLQVYNIENSKSLLTSSFFVFARG